MSGKTEALNKYFGFPSLHEYQEPIVDALLADTDTLAVLPTGSGKSICFQLPALMKSGLTVIVSPLLSLMDNQLQELRAKHIKAAAAYNSFMSPEEKSRVLSRLSSLKLLYISPEALSLPFIVERLKSVKVSMMVVDEAHCISQWGHEFRTDYLKIGPVRQALGRPCMAAFTATATPEVQLDIKKQLQMKAPKEFIHSVDRANIALFVQRCTSEREKKKDMVELVQKAPGPGLVYVSSRKKCEELKALLQEKTSHRVEAYHGGLENEARLMIQQQFLHGDLDVVVCTNSFGMGLNKANVEFVLHYHFPKDAESYIQEIGRAGRDGRQAWAAVLYLEEDIIIPQMLMEAELPPVNELGSALTVAAESNRGKITDNLINRMGWTETAARFLTYYLEKCPGKPEAELLEELEKQVQQRSFEKQKKLKVMIQWLENNEACRRRLLLQVFGEALMKRPEPCCDMCGHRLPFREHRGAEKEKETAPWEIRLEELFFGREREKHE
ncbi:RecQ family ATP-dependent DNA helicase [Marinococcus luteus]|uniref:RecQ family ATP-dependent DNA helicase n=1 Tax=Marinococcus luteus TaxID=1122204 RepID=UPI002ACCFF7D|nr:RecQ family ATP-dependent DNA helicase [Marinococcus luteus]MDZ5782338.1 RecQ family ATP-dependent DNA helicase [Marinococcus luteus]